MKKSKIIIPIIFVIFIVIILYFFVFKDLYYKEIIKKNILSENLDNIIISYYNDNVLVNKSYIQNNMILSVDYYNKTPNNDQILLNKNTNTKFEYNTQDSTTIKQSTITNEPFTHVNDSLIQNLKDNTLKFDYIKKVTSKNIETNTTNNYHIFKFTNKEENFQTYYFYNIDTNLIEKMILYSEDISKINVYEFKTETLDNIDSYIPEFITEYIK